MAETETERPGVLIVGGGESSSRALSDALARDGIAAAAAPTFLAGVGRFARGRFRVVILSLSRATEADLEAIPALREARPDAHLLVSFPLDRRDLAARALAAGADASLLEPYYLEEVLAVIRRALSREPAPSPREDGPARAQLSDLEWLAAAVAHFVRNPLQSLQFHFDDAADPDAPGMLGEVRRIGDVVTALELPEEFRTDVSAKTFDLNDAVREALRSLAEADGAAVVWRLKPGLPPVLGRRAPIVEALRTLADLGRTGGAAGALVVETAAGALLSRRQEAVTVRFTVPDASPRSEERDDMGRPDGGTLARLLGPRIIRAFVGVRVNGGDFEFPRVAGAMIVVVRLPASGGTEA